jgi:hypothetical protein
MVKALAQAVQTAAVFKKYPAVTPFPGVQVKATVALVQVKVLPATDEQAVQTPAALLKKPF